MTMHQILSRYRIRIILTLFLATGILHSTSGQTIKTIEGKSINPAALDSFLKHQMDSLGMPGLSIAIINDAKIVYHRSLGVSNQETKAKVDDQTVFEAASLTKPIFAFFVMKMVEKGVLSLDTPLYRYLPNPDIDYDDRYKLITARMVLDHTTGLPNWRHHNRGEELDIKFTPGTQYQYSGEGFEYLANAIAHRMGTNLKKLEVLFRQEVATPLGVNQAHFVWNDYLAAHKATGYWTENDKFVPREIWKPVMFSAAAGLQTEAVSYANFLIAVMENKGLKRELLEEMLKEHVQITDSTTLKKYNARALGFAVQHVPTGVRYIHGGSNGDFQSYFVLYKDRKKGYVFFTNCDKGYEFNANLQAFLSKGR